MKANQTSRIAEREDRKNSLSDKLISVILFFSFCLSVILLTSSPVYAKTGFDLNVAGTGARPMGMGRAYTAVADDINAVFTNPAGLGKQKSWGMTSMSTKLMNRVEYKMLGGTYSTNYGTFGVGYLSALTPAGYVTTDKASIMASPTPITYGISQLSLSYGLDLSDMIQISRTAVDLSVGATYRATSSKFEGTDGSGNGTGLDVGLIFRPLPSISTGLTLQNVAGGVTWKNGTKEDLPLVTKLGGACELGRTRVAIDLENGAGASLLHGGAEYRLTDNVALRVGAEQTPSGASETVLNLTAGVGLKLAGFSFDYAYRQDSGLAENSNHYISLSFQPDFRNAVASAVVRKEITVVKGEKTAPVQIDGVYRLSPKNNPAQAAAPVAPVVEVVIAPVVATATPATTAAVAPASVSSSNVLSYFK